MFQQQVVHRTASVAERPDDRMIVTLFGRFSCRIAGRVVAFDRRRDQHVLTYVALAPGASVRRVELIAAFWPNALPAAASQGLRTTLFRLRRAIAAAAGGAADRYLRIGHSVALDPSGVTIDACSFRDCIALAATEEAGGNDRAARQQYLLAKRLRGGELLASEAVAPQLAPRTLELDQLFSVVERRLADHRR